MLVVGCSGGSDADPSDTMTVSIQASPAILIPATTSSCIERSLGVANGKSIGKNYFQLSPPIINIVDKSYKYEVRIELMEFVLTGPQIGGKYSCVFASQDLQSLYYYQSVANDGSIVASYWPGIFDSIDDTSNYVDGTTSLVNPNSKYVYVGCPITCGGVTIPTGTGIFGLTGTWKVIAIKKKFTNYPDITVYEESPLEYSGTFSVENKISQ